MSTPWARPAIRALQQLAPQGGGTTQAVFEALAEIGDKSASSALEQGLASPDKFVNVGAAYALARLGRKDTAVKLESALQGGAGSGKVGILSAYYLVCLDRASGLDHFVALMNKPDSGLPVLAAVALKKLAADPNPGVCATALSALVGLGEID